MKKALSLLLAFVLCLSLCACGDSQDTQLQLPDNGNSENSSTSQSEEPLIIEYISSGKPIINRKRFSELIEMVELTTENWTDYIEVCSYTKKTIIRDAFGEITSEETKICYELGAKGDKYYYYRDIAIELNHKITGETVILQSVGDSNCIDFAITEDFSLNEYECTRIKGTLYLVDVPIEVIAECDDGNREFFVGSNDMGGYDDRIYIPGVDGRHLDGAFFLLV